MDGEVRQNPTEYPIQTSQSKGASITDWAKEWAVLEGEPIERESVNGRATTSHGEYGCIEKTRAPYDECVTYSNK